MSHTPGPWYPFVADNTRFPGIDHDNGSVILYGEAGEDCGIRGKDIEERTANAHLIAAAPDLLAALERIIDECKVFCNDSMDIDNYAVDQAREAIRKAKGGAE
jgi:hypothetical protein